MEKHVIVGVSKDEVVSHTYFIESDANKTFDEFANKYDHVVWMCYDGADIHHVEYGPAEAYRPSGHRSYIMVPEEEDEESESEDTTNDPGSLYNV